MTLLPDFSCRRIEVTYNDILPLQIRDSYETRPSSEDERKHEALDIEVGLLWFAASRETFLTGRFARDVVQAAQKAFDEGDYGVTTSPNDRKVTLMQGRNREILSNGRVTREKLTERLYQIVKTNNLTLEQLKR